MAGKTPLFALCPMIEPNGAYRVPQIFATAPEREEWLDRETTLDDLGIEGERLPPDLTGWPEEARVEMVKHLEGLRHTKRETKSRISTNRSQGWVAVPVRPLADYPGSKCTHSLRDFLPLEQIGEMSKLSATADDELARLVEDAWDRVHGVPEADSSAGFANCLADDWAWERIDADARRRVGHRYSGRKHASIAAVVIGAAYDLEEALFQVHPGASCAAGAIFWKSWQIEQYLTSFCARLVTSETARALAGAGDTAGEVERARWFLLGQLNAFAATLTRAAQVDAPPTGMSGGEAAGPDVIPKKSALNASEMPIRAQRRHGFEPDMTRHREIVRIVGLREPNCISNKWREDKILRLICEDLDTAEIEVPESWKKGKPQALDGAPVKAWTKALELAKKTRQETRSRPDQNQPHCGSEGGTKRPKTDNRFSRVSLPKVFPRL
jgi:hypothetical protein